MTFLLHSIKPLSPVRFPVCAHLPVVLASLWAANSNRVVATFNHLVIAFLHPLGSVALSVLPPFHAWRLGEAQERNDNDSRDD